MAGRGPRAAAERFEAAKHLRSRAVIVCDVLSRRGGVYPCPRTYAVAQSREGIKPSPTVRVDHFVTSGRVDKADLSNSALESTWRAIGVCVVGFLIQALILAVVLSMFGGTSSV